MKTEDLVVTEITEEVVAPIKDAEEIQPPDNTIFDIRLSRGNFDAVRTILNNQGLETELAVGTGKRNLNRWVGLKVIGKTKRTIKFGDIVFKLV